MLFFSDAIIGTVGAIFAYADKNKDKIIPNLLHELAGKEPLKDSDWVMVRMEDDRHVTVCKL